MHFQKEIQLKAKPRGFNLITAEIENEIDYNTSGICNLFIKHTSAGLAISENYDPDVQTDLESIFNNIVPERQPYYKHIIEGPDDMPSHAKSILVGPSLSIPITNGKLNLGTWQGIYLCEFRNHGGPRKIVITIV